eukprot:m.291042 g.291042  ORF g.291042 m.291042 type:complete len:395 (+) comp17811_c0_seq4:140-1324(+)
MKLFVGNLPFGLNLVQAAQLIRKAAPTHFVIAKSFDKTIAKGHFFLDIDTEDEAIVDKLKTLKQNGRQIRVEAAKAAKPALFDDAKFRDTAILVAGSSQPEIKASLTAARRPQAAATAAATSDINVRSYSLQPAPCAIIDIGVNLANRRYKDPIKVLQDAEAFNVSPLILTGTSVRASQDVLRLAKKQPTKLYCTAGVHPHDAKSCNADTISTLRALAREPEVLAIGETGLDYDRNFSTPEVQREWFQKQVALAVELDMPLFCHERDAAKDFLQVLDTFPSLPPLVVHCYTGSQDTLAQYIERGYYIGVTGFISMQKRGSQLRQFLAATVPLNRLMIETDAPFMTPDAVVKTHGKTNVPRNLPVVLQTVADLYALPVEEVAVQLTETTRAFFRL